MGPDTDADTDTTTTNHIYHRVATHLPVTPQYALLVVLAVATLVGAALRFTALDARPIHYDEGVHLLVSWDLATEGTYTYNGYSHGPPLIYLSALLFEVVGTDIVLARGLVAALSLGVFPALYLLRDDIPPVALGVAAIFFAVHPWVLYTARFYRNDAIVATGGLLILGLYAQVRRRKWSYTRDDFSYTVILAVTLGTVAMVTMAAKEIGYLLVAAVVAAIAVVVHFDSRFTERSWPTVRRTYLPTGLVGVAAGAGLLTFLALFSGWPPTPTRAPTYWLEGLEVWLTRSSGDVYESEVTYYVGRLIRETPLVFGLALLGCLGTLRRPDTSWLRWPLVAWVAFVGLVLSFHDHQWLWLMTHVFVPVAVLAGCGVVDIVAGLVAVASSSPVTLTPAKARIPTQTSLSDWGRTPEHDTATRMRVPAGRTILTLVVAALVVTPVVLGAAAGDPRDVEGVTAAGDRDIEQEAFTLAQTSAADTGCDVLVGPELDPHPASWYLRATPHTFIDAWNASHLQSSHILVGGSELSAALNETEWEGSVQAIEGQYTLYVARPPACE